MSYKSIIKKLIPPIILELFRKKDSKYIWEGIYNHRLDVPTINAGYDNENRINYLIKDAQLALIQSKKNQFKGFERHIAFGLIASLVNKKDGMVRVLDFGGGAGTGFVQLISTLINRKNIQYDIVELYKTCLACENLFPEEIGVKFINTIPNKRNYFDIVYACSSLQYIDNYQDLLFQLANLNANYLLISDLPAGNIPTYASKQLNLHGQVLAYWFFNVNEIIQIVESFGYSCIYSGKCDKEYDQSNFPVTHRIGKMHNLLFLQNQKHINKHRRNYEKENFKRETNE